MIIDAEPIPHAPYPSHARKMVRGVPWAGALGGKALVEEDEFISIAKAKAIVADGFKRDTDTEDDVNRFLRQNRAQTLKQIIAAREWLRKYQRRSSLNRTISTDLMQVRCSAMVGFPVSHGALLVALYLEGMEVKRCDPSSRDAWTNFSLKLA